MSNKVTEQWVLDNALHNNIEKIEGTFFPLFKGELTVKTANTTVGYMTAIYHQSEPTFAEWKQSRVSELRAAKYPAIEDQLDYIYHNGVEAWKSDLIDPVKESFPKQ